MSSRLLEKKAETNPNPEPKISAINFPHENKTKPTENQNLILFYSGLKSQIIIS